MSFGSPSPFDPDGANWWSKGSPGLTKRICGVSHLLSDIRTLLRFGTLSRAPLRLLRLLIHENSVECEWIARYQDPWDADLSRDIGRRHSSLQALKDAIDVRSLLFISFPDLATARLRVYRETVAHPRELIILGSVRRQDNTFRSVHSLAMRAKLVGFQFRLDNDHLCGLDGEEYRECGD